ncbi:MAG: leucine-rich repeat domain-containing protein [Candidatus Poribacteria bacterium]|nr:leucine-rich repeat domain-containing protein [Candidatus Poribacteria bacterium]
MKNSKKFIVLISAVWILILFNQNVQAQQNLAQEAYAIIEDACLICHGENGSFSDDLLIEYTALIEGGTVIPENPEDSVFYQRLIETDIAKRMPLGQPSLAPEAIETIYQWIAAGAPDWNAIPKPKPGFITNDTLLETIENHVNSLSPRDKSFARYFTLTHLYNAGETTEALNAYRRALSKLINSLSWGRNVVKPQPIDAEQTIFYIDLRDYEWDVRNDAWTQIEQTYPYKMTFDAPTQTHFSEKLTTLQQEMNCEVPFINVDWFLATASLPPLYHDILALPETDRELEAALEVFVAENLLNAPGKRVWRAGFNNSRVSRHNRVVERHISRYGAYWKSYDFAGSAESQNIFTHPLDFTHDGGEIIFNLPNGLQAYYLADGEGNRLNEAPISIVSNPAVSDPTVRNGLSCIGCHTKGMQTFEDEVRAVVEQVENPPFNKERALDLYVEKTVMDALVEEDTQRYRDALEAAGGVFGGIEPVQRLHEAFQAPLSAAHAAAAVGLETDMFLEKITKSPTLQNLLGTLVLENGTVKRDAWTSDFHDVISGINSPDIVPPPVVERPEIIPGAGVHIPDPNLRATLNRILDKPSDAPITVTEMESFTAFGVHNTHRQINGSTQIIQETLNNKGIENLTGLEYAINIQGLSISDEGISDLSPISKLIKLRSLRLHFTNVSDLTPISGLTKIREFVFENCPEITSLSALEGLTELENIQAGHNFKISDLSPLAGKKKFKSILLWGPPISDLSPLANLPNIENINMCGNEISVIPSFENAPKLKTLYIFNNNVSNVSTLQNLKGLERLNLRDNKITDITPLSGLTNLKWLDLTANPITDFSPLAGLVQTTKILFGEVPIPDVNLRAAIAEALGKDVDDVFVSISNEEMATLTTLRASNRAIKDLTGLEYAINLEYLHAHSNQISDLSPLSDLIKLKVLDVYNNPIESLVPIAGLSNLEVITIIGNKISDISPLAGLANLRHFLTWGNPISNLFPLANLTQLETLDICGSEASDISVLANLTGLKSLYLIGNGISDVSALSGLTSLERLKLERNNISDVSPLSELTNLKLLTLNNNSITDFSSLSGLTKTTITRAFNPGTPTGGPKIEGPWLWVTVPGERLDSDTDLLAKASAGTITEQQIATIGAKQGKSVGNNRWTQGSIAPSGDLNIINLLDEIGSEINSENNNHIIYGCVTLDSPLEQETQLFFGFGDNAKIWLNGRLVYQSFVRRRAGDYQDFVPCNLEKGVNVLLVAVEDGWEFGWSGHFGFEEGTEYTVIPPDAVSRLTFSATETTNLLAGDTLTLNLTAENMTDLAGWQTDIAFDPNVLEAVEVAEGDFLKSEGSATFFQGGTIDNTEGKINGMFAARQFEGGVSGTGTLLSVTFMAKAGGETQITLESFEFGASDGTIIPTVPPNITITVGEYPAWDVNQDGRGSILDLILVAQDFGSGAPANLRTDVNRDGVINVQDLIIVSQHIGESVDAAASPVLAMDNKALMPAMVQAWIAQARIEDDGSAVFRQGIENLERLLASLLPEKTALLANYPNPFNPETWIPYHLAKPADVTLTIYAANGAIVRTLALGHQAAGIYQSRIRAAHWDGKNSVGESVASGIYFYTLSAGDFTATRKMLILK